MDSFDIAVIGAGPGGYPAAIRAAQLGAHVALIEREAIGGTCLNWGCIPTKTLIAAAHLREEIAAAGAMGIGDGAAPRVDYAALMAHKNHTVAQLQKGVRTLLASHGVAVLEGTASFVNRNVLAISNGSDAPRQIKTGHTIIATGSASAMPDFLPRHPRVVDSRAFLDLGQLPRRLVVLGGGYIGCELACMAAQLGAEVTLVELLDDVLPLLDADVRREVKRNFERKLKIRLLTGKPLENIHADSAGVRGMAGEEQIEGDLLLVAVGRQPVTEGLAIHKAGLHANDKGFIEVDECGRTEVATIHAVGDVTGGPQLAHAATSQGVLAAENIAAARAMGRRMRRAETLVPGVIFTAPEVATVGLSETQAQTEGRAIKTGRFPFAALGRALTERRGEGFVKWIVDAQSDQVVGAAAVGPHASELIAEATLAVRMELTASEVGRTIHAHPTFGEAWMEAAHAVHGACVHTAKMKRAGAS